MQRFKSGAQIGGGTEGRWLEIDSSSTTSRVDVAEGANSDLYNEREPNGDYYLSGSPPQNNNNSNNVIMNNNNNSNTPFAAAPAKDSLFARLSPTLKNSRTYQYLQQSKIINLLFGTGSATAKFKLFLQVLLLCWLFLSLARKFQYTDNDDARFQHLRNTECQESGIQFYQKRAKDFESDPDLCVLPNQYKKFIWIFVDSLAFDQSEDLRSLFPNKKNVHRIMNHGFKFSTAIYTTFFTGKIPTNYAGHEIFSDNLFYQMKRAGMNMKFVGPAFPTLHLLGESNQPKYFSEKLSVLSETTPFEFLRSNGEAFLSSLAKQDASVLFTTNVIDDRIHKTGKHDPRTKELISDIKFTLRQVKKFVDSNPDYLFILNADHGGSPTGGVHEGQLHGEPSNGNEAWIMFYNPTLTTLGQQGTWLDTVDVCGTVAKYFSGVNIPLESIGKAAANTDNTIHRYKIAKSNTLQLKQLVDLKDFPYDKPAFQQSITESDPSLAVDKMEQFVMSVKVPLINFKRFPTSELILIGLFIAISQISLVISECGDYPILYYLKTFPLSILLSGMYLYLDLLFLKFDYFKTFPRIFPFYSMFFGICFFHQMIVSLLGSNNNNNSNSSNNDESAPSSSGSLTSPSLPTTSGNNYSLSPSMRRTLYTCTIRMTAVFSLLWGFRFYVNHVALINGLPFTHLLGYLTLLAGILSDAQQQNKINSVAGLIENFQKGPLRREVLYFGIIFLIYLYEWSEGIFFMQLAYLGIFGHAVFSMLYSPQSLIYPATVLLFAISNLKERIYLMCILSPMYYLLAQVLKDLPSWNSSSLASRMSTKFAFLLLINISFECYVAMGGQFNMDVVVEAGAVGVVNVEQYPGFSGFLMGYHKLGYFFILVAYLARIIVPDKRDEIDIYTGAPATSWFSSFDTGIYFWKYLLVKAMVLMWVFHLSFWLYKDYLTCFLATVIVTIVTLGFGSVLFLQIISLTDLTNKLVKYLKLHSPSSMGLAQKR